jgi:hypothetical protein
VYNLLFRSLRAESRDPVQLRVVEGAVPPDFPAGTYYLAGPGLFSDDHGSTVHPLDGHGYLRVFRFDAGRAVHYSARYVETAAKREEHVGDASWRFTHRGPFSVLQGGTRVGNVKVMKNVANTSVLRWGGRLLCLWEGGGPYELHPRTLETIGTFDLLHEVARDDVTETTTHRRRPWLREAGIWNFCKGHMLGDGATPSPSSALSPCRIVVLRRAVLCSFPTSPTSPAHHPPSTRDRGSAPHLAAPPSIVGPPLTSSTVGGEKSSNP